MIYEGIYKFTEIMDQFVQGLKNLCLFKLIRAFPEEFVCLLTYKGISPSDVVDAIYIHQNVITQPADLVIIGFLKRYL